MLVIAALTASALSDMLTGQLDAGSVVADDDGTSTALLGPPEATSYNSDTALGSGAETGVTLSVLKGVVLATGASKLPLTAGMAITS